MAKKLSAATPANRKKSPTSASDDPDKSSSGPASGKNGKVIFVRLNVEGWRELRKLAAEVDTSVQALMIEGINDLLDKRGRPKIATNPLS